MGYNTDMSEFRFYQPLTVRYGDLDPQGHVNNAGYVTYLEHARVAYIRALDLWDGQSFLDVGFIIARLELDYQAPILLTDQARVGVRISRLGEKSLDMKYQIENPDTGLIYAQAITVLVGYDYREQKTISLSETWRAKVASYERIPRRTP